MDTVQPRAFSTLLRHRRIAAGLTQEELAERAGVSVRRLGDLERGASWAPRTDTVALLAEALGLSPEEHAALEEAARRLRTPTLAAPARTDAAMPPLVGRHRELALLERHLAGQGPPLLVLAGEPGIGKTRLLHAAIPRAVAQGWRVLEGGCQRRGGQEPYSPLVEALERYLHQQSALQVRRAILEGCAWLVRLLPELADGPIDPLPAWTLPADQERRLLLKATHRFLVNVAGPSGTLLVLDDLQWAGADALDLLVTLLRAPSDTPVRVLAAYRETEVQPGDPLAATLADLAQAELATHRKLDPLTHEEAHALLASLLEEAASPVLERIVQRTGGVPFFLVSYARDMRSAEPETSRAESLPWDLGQSIRRRVLALPAGARELLGVAAVAGRSVSRAVLLAAAEQPEPAVVAGLDAACHAQLLEETGADAYRFVHDLIREVVEADLGAARRVVLHRRLATVLQAQQGEPPIEALAYHWARSGEQEQAVIYLEQAGDRARRQAAPMAAADYYADLVARLDAMGRTLASAHAREKLGTMLVMAGQYDAGLAALDQAIEAFRTAQDLDGAGRVTAQIGMERWARGAAAEGLARLRPMVALLEPQGPSRGLASLYVALAYLLHATGQYDEVPATAERAAELAHTVGDDGLLAHSARLRANALVSAGPAGVGGCIEQAIRLLTEGARLAEAICDVDPLMYNLNFLAVLRVITGDFGAGKLLYEQTVPLAEQLRGPFCIVIETAQRGWCAFLRGAWDEARGDLTRAVALGREAGLPWTAPRALLYHGQLCLAEGAWEEASRALEEAAALAARMGNLQVLRETTGLRAELDVLSGRPDAACARLLPLLDRPGLEEYDVIALLPVLAWAHLELGEMAQAERALTEAIRRTRPEHLRLVLVEALRVQAMLAVRQGRWEDAASSLEEGLVLARNMPYPYAEARCLAVYGHLHAERGEPEAARERQEAALAIFRRLGARKDVEHTEQLLAKRS